MTEFSAKEYWLLKEIKEEVRDYVSPRILLKYMFRYIQGHQARMEMDYLIQVIIKDLI